MGTRAAGGVQSMCPLNNLNSFHCIIINLCENVCWQNISAKFDNQPDPKSDLVCSVTLEYLSMVHHQTL